MSDWGPLESCERVLRDVVRGLDADVLDPADAQVLVGRFDRLERLAAAGKTIAAKRVAESGRWRSSGDRSEADWLARTTGTSVGQARGTLETAKKLAAAPATDEAFRSGELSPAQAEAVAAGAAADPASERRLLEVAKAKSLPELREESARVRAAAVDQTARQQRIHRERYFRSWTDAEGARMGQYRMTPDMAAIIERAVKPYADAAFRAARAAGERESADAYAADGLVAMARDRAARGGTGGFDAGGSSIPMPPAPPSPSPAPVKPVKPLVDMTLLVNLEALRRGSLLPDETCEIPGVGPVPLDVAEELFGEAILRLVIRDGVDIRTVVHFSRQPNAVQRTALLVRDGGRCVVPSCGRRGAHIDHVEEWAITRHTTLTELAHICTFHHDQKTHRGYDLTHGPHGWEWRHPDGTIEYERPPPDDDND